MMKLIEKLKNLVVLIRVKVRTSIKEKVINFLSEKLGIFISTDFKSSKRVTRVFVK